MGCRRSTAAAHSRRAGVAAFGAPASVTKGAAMARVSTKPSFQLSPVTWVVVFTVLVVLLALGVFSLGGTR